MPYEKHKCFWAVTDATRQLVCLPVYRKGAWKVLRRLGIAEDSLGSMPRKPSPEAAKLRPQPSGRKTPYRLETGRQTGTGRQSDAGQQQRRRKGE